MKHVALPPVDMAQSLAAVRAGGIPLRARMRLAEEAGPGRKLFTSDLSINEFLLTEELQVEPISQVMGCEVMHIGRIPDYKGRTGEMEVISSGHRNARALALSRLFQEAQLLGADAVIGVHLAERWITIGQHGKGGDDGDEVIEFTVVGTAIRAPWLAHEPGMPIITDLSGQDFWALAREGYQPCGFLFDYMRYHVWHVMKPGAWNLFGELTDASQAIETARHTIEARIAGQAQRMGAEFVVGSDLSVKAGEVPCGYEGCELNDMDIDIVWSGTAIRRMSNWKPAAAHAAPPLVLGMIKLGRNAGRDLIEDEDENDEVRKQAREIEERAAEGGKE